jgi:hypothetical protein
MSIKAQVTALLDKTSTFTTNHGTEVAASMDASSNLVLHWLPYLERHKTGVADELLGGATSSLMEATACATLGLVRPALFAMRTEVDLILTWLFFKDHRVEWENVNATGDGFKLKKEMFEYFTRYVAGFGERYGLLKQIARRTETDTYRFLSAHIHSQSATTLPEARLLEDVVRDRQTCDELAEIATAVDEYVSDILIAIYIRDWAHLPPLLVETINRRFVTEQQKRTFYQTV